MEREKGYYFVMHINHLAWIIAYWDSLLRRFILPGTELLLPESAFYRINEDRIKTPNEHELEKNKP